MREDIEIDGGKVIVCFIHSMFSMADMVEPASPSWQSSGKSTTNCLINVIHGFSYPGPANTWVILHMLEPIAIVVGSSAQRIQISETRD